MTRLLARLICLVEGHDEFRFCDAHARSFGYACARCGHESAVTCDYNEPVVTAHGNQMRHVILNPRLVPQKKRTVPTWLHSIHYGRGA